MASKFLMNQAIQDAEAIDQGAGIPATGVVPQNMRQYFAGTNPGAYGSGDWRSNMNQSYNWPDSGARYEYNRPYNMRGVAGEVGEYGQIPGQGIMATDQAQKKGMFSNMLSKLKNIPTPMNMIRSAVRNPLDPQSPNFNPMLEGQLGTYGNYVGETGEDPLQGQNLVSGFGTNDPTAQLRKRLQKIRTRKIAQTTSSRNKQAEILRAIQAQTAAENAGYQGTPGGNVGSGVFAKMDQSGKTYGPYGGGGDKGQHTTQGGNWGAAPGTKGAWSPGAKKDGGRIGYQDGELVEQETDFIEGPQGGEEFQETVVEGQEQPSREQLEALSMEIFQLPLEELDEQQLLVVYQEAMQGQPMEESVQEDEVQFAAQGGLAGLL